ncbi:phosphocarrier protein HPr [Halalkalicoccus tibetensis]|uniref:Phosphocarrier protein HPr n=1 Tax=Halalkalicoccus tibetensis TaxID=175632 RepID=A0ABD5V505_9EURY
MERVVEIVPEAGLHARPAAKFVETANEYDAEVTVAPVEDGEGEGVAASSMIAVTSLGVKGGEEVRLSAEGEDAEAALDALEEVLSTPEEGDGE